MQITINGDAKREADEEDFEFLHKQLSRALALLRAAHPRFNWDGEVEE